MRTLMRTTMNDDNENATSDIEISVFSGDSSVLRSNYKFCRDTADRRLTDSIEDVISEYLLVGDSVTCCENLEKILIEGAAHHLFISESSLIASVANFWIGAGESLLTLTRNSEWNITPKVWSFLVYGCHFLKSCKDPINYNWLTSFESDSCYTHESENVIGVSERAYNDQTGAHILQLGEHCLTYGRLLACICYGPHSQLVSHVQNIIDH
ncbi:SET domain protein [Trifolium pratense]|uniref:SET domain protein n=1 Tax=Trifolium pratense TaxID=57577 RepID=A0A2K3PAT5_TRIPR|nr:SET domain protein [Trifolium pratense]